MHTYLVLNTQILCVSGQGHEVKCRVNPYLYLSPSRVCVENCNVRNKLWMTPNGTDLVIVLPNQLEGKSREEKRGGKERRQKQASSSNKTLGSGRVKSAPQQQGELLGGNLSSLVLHDAADVWRRLSLRSF